MKKDLEVSPCSESPSSSFPRFSSGGKVFIPFSLHFSAYCSNPIASGQLIAEVIGGDSKMVSSSCRTEKTSPVVLKRGGRGIKADPPKQETNESPMQRRRSCRIQVKLKEEKELLVRRRVELLDDPDEAGHGKKTGKGGKRSRKDETVANEEMVAKKQRVNEVLKSEESPRAKVGLISKIAVLEERVDSENGGSSLVEKSDSLKVKETLRLFNKHYLHFVQVSSIQTHSLQ